MAARPYKLGFSEGGIFYDHWGSYGTPEAAWKAFDRQWAEIVEGRRTSYYQGHFIVVGPEITEYVGVGRSAGDPLPFSKSARPRQVAA